MPFDRVIRLPIALPGVRGAVLRFPSQGPGDVLDYTVDASQLLQPLSDSIASCTAAAATGLTLSLLSNTATGLLFWLSGGTVGSDYAIALTFTTAGGRTFARTVWICFASPSQEFLPNSLPQPIAPPPIPVTLTVPLSGQYDLVADTYLVLGFAPDAFAITGVAASAGDNGGSFVANLRINGVSAGGLGAVVVGSQAALSTPATTGNLTCPAGGLVDLVVSSVTGAPHHAYVVVQGLSLVPSGSTRSGGGPPGSPGLRGAPGMFAGPVSSTYSASGAIAITDTVALVTAASALAMTLAAGDSDGQGIVIKCLGAGTVTLTAAIDGQTGAVLAANAALRLVWDNALSTWLSV